MQWHHIGDMCALNCRTQQWLETALADRHCLRYEDEENWSAPQKLIQVL